MTNYNSFYRIQNISEGIFVCIVNIPGLIDTLTSDTGIKIIRGKKSILFSQENFKRKIFSLDDLVTVNNFKILKKQLEWIAGRFAVKTLVQKLLSESEDLAAIKAAYLPDGSPYLAKFPDCPISISHSGNYAAAGISLSGAPLGIDIEKIEKNRKYDFTKVAFTERERELISDSRPEEIYRNWTLKESYMKFTGKGFQEGLRNIEIFDGEIFVKSEKLNNISTYTDFFDGYSFATVYRC